MERCAAKHTQIHMHKQIVHGCTSEVALVPARELLRPFAKNAEDHIFSQLAEH